MLENPIVTIDYKSPTAYKIRDEYPEKFLDDPQVYIQGFKHEKDRIKQEQEKNSDLDYMPNQTVAHHQFRERNIKLEIQPDMRFTAKTSLERIEQLLKDHMQTQVENYDFSKKKKSKFSEILNSQQHYSSWEKNRLLAKEMIKNLLPSLHNKTHFAAAQSLYNNCPLSLLDTKANKTQGNQVQDKQQEIQYELDDVNQENKKSKANIKHKVQIIDQNDKKQSQTNLNQQIKKESKDSQENAPKLDQMEAFNPVETSKKALLLCNVIRKKDQKIRTLHKGSGRLICTLDKSIQEVYQTLYNKNLAFQKTFQ